MQLHKETFLKLMTIDLLKILKDYAIYVGDRNAYIFAKDPVQELTIRNAGKNLETIIMMEDHRFHLSPKKNSISNNGQNKQFFLKYAITASLKITIWIVRSV